MSCLSAYLRLLVWILTSDIIILFTDLLLYDANLLGLYCGHLKPLRFLLLCLLWLRYEFQNCFRSFTSTTSLLSSVPTSIRQVGIGIIIKFSNGKSESSWSPDIRIFWPKCRPDQGNQGSGRNLIGVILIKSTRMHWSWKAVTLPSKGQNYLINGVRKPFFYPAYHY